MLDTLILEYDEVNKAADKLLIDYASTSTTTINNYLLPRGRDEKKIYSFSNYLTKDLYDINDEYDYGINDEYDDDENREEDDDDDDNEADEKFSNGYIDAINYDQIEVGDSDWDIDDDDTESMYDMNLDERNQQTFTNEVG